MIKVEILVGYIVGMKKPHPCGGNEWEILRVGMEIRMRCIKCGRLIALKRSEFERGLKKIIKYANKEES